MEQDEVGPWSIRDCTVRFWGVRGSIACPGPDTVRYGGNTSCVEIRCGDHLMVFDGGTGLRLAGQRADGRRTSPPSSTSSTATPISTTSAACLFLRRAMTRAASMRIWAGHLNGNKGIEAVLNNMMIAPLFPIPMGIFTAKMNFIDFAAGDLLTPHPGIRLRHRARSTTRTAPPAIGSNMAARSWPTSPIPSIGPGERDPNVLGAHRGRRRDDL